MHGQGRSSFEKLDLALLYKIVLLGMQASFQRDLLCYSMSAFEQHMKSLKQQHASELKDLHTLLDKQSNQIDSLDSQTAALQSGKANAERAADSARQQLCIINKKLTGAQAELATAASDHANVTAQLHDTESKLQTAKHAAKHAADRDVNMQHQLTALKQKLAASSSEPEILRLQSELGQAHSDLKALRQEAQTGLICLFAL